MIMMPANPEPVPSDVLWPTDDYDEAQVLTLIRMWSGFESEMITDTQLLELLGLEGYQDVDLPDWMMTELGSAGQQRAMSQSTSSCWRYSTY